LIAPAWKELNTALFQQNEFLEFAEEHYEELGARKIQDHYNAVLAKLQKYVDSGNKVGRLFCSLPVFYNSFIFYCRAVKMGS
jgi:precorrin-2 methylase